MATGDVYRMAMMGTYNAEPIMMTFGLVEGSGGAGPDPMADACAAVDAALGGGTTTIAGLSADMIINQIQAQDVQPGTKPRFILNVGPHPGAVTGASLPGICAGVISWRSAIKGPANRGRMYVPGTLDASAVEGFLTVDGLAAISGFASLLFDPFVSDGTAYQLDILSYVPHSKPRVLRAAVPVLSFSVDNHIKSQRRRGVGVRISRKKATP